MGWRGRGRWHKLSLADKVILIAGLVLMIGCLFLWEFTDSLVAMWMAVVSSWIVAYVIFKQANNKSINNTAKGFKIFSFTWPILAFLIVATFINTFVKGDYGILEKWLILTKAFSFFNVIFIIIILGPAFGIWALAKHLTKKANKNSFN